MIKRVYSRSKCWNFLAASKGSNTRSPVAGYEREVQHRRSEGSLLRRQSVRHHLGAIMKIEHNLIIEKVCNYIAVEDFRSAGSTINNEYPFVPLKNVGRSYTPREMTKTFLRDGFIDRYKGIKLVYPPVLRIISCYLPKEFPYHKNGKMNVGHMAYWDIFPTIDHLLPVARGGADIESNWMSCSMLTNSIKSNWTLEQLQWKILPAGDLQDWDGMISWFIKQTEKNSNLLNIPYIKTWYNAAKKINHE